MSLKHITFTGVDEQTDIKELQKIQQEYPIAEFGVLVSKNWEKNGNRYPNPAFIENLRDKGLNLSCHVCGSVARSVLQGNWGPLLSIIPCLPTTFNRCQLNVSGENPNHVNSFLKTPVELLELIIQQKSIFDMQLYHNIRNRKRISVLLDASGGRGVDTGWQICLELGVKSGYAGGITPENVENKLTSLLSEPQIQDFWIDMESGVRTDDWFDLNKVRKVLEICMPIVQQYNNYG